MTCQGTLAKVRATRNETMFTVLGVPDAPGTAAKLFSEFARAGIPVTMIVQNAPDAGATSITFTVRRQYADTAMQITRRAAESLNAEGILRDDAVGRISIQGSGLEQAAGIAGQLFGALAENEINVLAINATADTVSCIVEDGQTERGVSVLKEKFSLELEGIE